MLALAKCYNFDIKFFYVMGKVLTGELSCIDTGFVGIYSLLFLANLKREKRKTEQYTQIYRHTEVFIIPSHNKVVEGI